RRDEVNSGDVFVGDDGDPRARTQCLDALPQARKKTTTDRNIVGARVESHSDHVRFRLAQRRCHDDFSAPSPRCLGSWTMISSTILSCGSSRDCTMMSAWA